MYHMKDGDSVASGKEHLVIYASSFSDNTLTALQQEYTQASDISNTSDHVEVLLHTWLLHTVVGELSKSWAKTNDGLWRRRHNHTQWFVGKYPLHHQFPWNVPLTKKKSYGWHLTFKILRYLSDLPHFSSWRHKIVNSLKPLRTFVPQKKNISEWHDAQDLKPCCLL